MVKPSDFGLFLKEKRKAAHLTQDDLASAINKSGQYISNIEKGKNNAPPNPSDIEALIRSVQFQCNISGILESSTAHVKENPTESEQDYLSWLLREINIALTHSIVEAFKLHYENNAYGKRLLVKIGDLEKHIISLVWQIFALNAKDETFKTLEEMGRSRNTYELIQQRPLNYFQYHFDVDWLPQRDLSASEKEWFHKLYESLRQNSVLWFFDFV